MNLLFMFGLPLMAALAFILLIVAVALIIETKKKIARTHQGQVASEFMSEDSNDYIRSFIAMTNIGEQAVIKSFKGTILSSLLEIKLKDKLKDKLSVITKYCNMPLEDGKVPLCTTVYSVSTPEGDILIHLSPYNYGAYLKDNKPRYLLNDSEYELEEFVNDDSLSVSDPIRIGYPANIKDDNVTVLQIEDIIKSCVLEHIEYPEEGYKHKIRYFALEKLDNRYVLTRQAREIREITRDLLDVSYNDITFEYEGEKITVPMGQGSRLMSSFIDNRENISIFGAAGTGKSRLADDLAAHAARCGNTAVIFITPVMLEEVQKVELLPQLIKELQTLKNEEGLTPLFIIDEAERALQKSEDGVHTVTNSFMLSLLDGQIQKLLNCSCILTFNCDINLLNEKAFRTGRMGLIAKFEEIDVARSEKLITLLRELNPTMIFDEAKWNTIKDRSIVLAEAYGCFITPSKKRVMASIIRAMKGESEPDTAVSPQASKPIISAPKSKIHAVPVQMATSERKHLIEDLQDAPSEPPQVKHYDKNRNRHNKHRRSGGSQK